MADLVLRGVSIVDPAAETVLPPRNIEITGTTITGIGSRVADPNGSIVDCTGLFALPGLVDAHAHIILADEAFLFVAGGVTTVRNMHGQPQHLTMARRFTTGDQLAPAVLTVSPILDGVDARGLPAVPHATIAPPPAEAAPFVADLAARGYRQLKVYDRLSAAQHRALCAAAAQVGMTVTGHCPHALTMEQAIAHGQICFEHLSGIPRGRLRPPPEGEPPPTGTGRILDAAARIDYDSVARLGRVMAERGVWICPTTRVLQPPELPSAATTGPPPAEYLCRGFRERWRRPETVSTGGVTTSWADYASALRVWNEGLLRCLTILAEAGVPILAGTDFPTPGAVPGFCLHDEVCRLAELGLGPWRALRAATTDAARFAAQHLAGAGTAFGAVAPGQRADLVLLAENPAENLDALRRPVGVVLRGRHLTRDQIDARLAAQRRVELRDPAAPPVDSTPVASPSFAGSGTVSGPAPVVGEITGELEDWCGDEILVRGSFRHRYAGDRWRITERWLYGGEALRHHVDLVLELDGTIEWGQFTTDHGYAVATSTLTREGAGYLVTIDHADGVREAQKLDGPLAPSERVGWSAFARWRASGAGPDRVWDGLRATGALTLDLANGRVAIRRATEVTYLILSSTPDGRVEARFTAHTGPLTYPRRLRYLPR